MIRMLVKIALVLVVAAPLVVGFAVQEAKGWPWSVGHGQTKDITLRRLVK